MRYLALVAVLSIFIGCSGGIQSTRSGGSGGSTTSEGEGGSEGGGGSEIEILQMVLTALTTVANDLFSGNQRLEREIAAVLMTHELDAVYQAETELSSMELLCSAPPPGDMPPFGVIAETPEETADTGVADDVTPMLRITGGVMEAGHAISIELIAGEEDVEARIRGGGWLFCALFAADLEVDGERWDLPMEEGANPTIEISIWPPEGAEVAEEYLFEYDNPIGPLEVLFSTPLPWDSVIELLEAERLVFWAGEEPIELYPSESPEALRFLEHLRI